MESKHHLGVTEAWVKDWILLLIQEIHSHSEATPALDDSCTAPADKCSAFAPVNVIWRIIF